MIFPSSSGVVHSGRARSQRWRVAGREAFGGVGVCGGDATARNAEGGDDARLVAMATQVDPAALAAAMKRAREEAELGGAESVSERVGEVFAGYQCSTLDVRLPRTHPPV